MILLSLFGRTRPFSTKQLAEKNAATFIKQNAANWGGFDVNAFNAAYQKEQYGSCVLIWNDFVNVHLYGDSCHAAKFEEVELDKPFT